MLVSCFTNSFVPHPVEDALPRIKAAGVENVELALRRSGDPADGPAPPDDALLDRWQTLLADLGLAVPSVSIMSGDPRSADVQALILDKLRIGARLGARIAVASAGEADTPEQKQQLYDFHRRTGDLAGELGMTIAFETHPGLCESWRRMRETMEELDHERLRLNFDTANYLYYNDRVEGEVALQRICEWVASLHLKDSRGVFHEWYFPALGDGGAVDFCRTLQIMLALDFKGPSTIELEGIEGKPPLSLDECQARLEKSVAHLRMAGWFDPS